MTKQLVEMLQEMRERGEAGSQSIPEPLPVVRGEARCAGKLEKYDQQKCIDRKWRAEEEATNARSKGHQGWFALDSFPTSPRRCEVYVYPICNCRPGPRSKNGVFLIIGRHHQIHGRIHSLLRNAQDRAQCEITHSLEGSSNASMPTQTLNPRE